MYETIQQLSVLMKNGYFCVQVVYFCKCCFVGCSHHLFRVYKSCLLSTLLFKIVITSPIFEFLLYISVFVSSAMVLANLTILVAFAAAGISFALSLVSSYGVSLDFTLIYGLHCRG